jgi:HEAT repeat protein
VAALATTPPEAVRRNAAEALGRLGFTTGEVISGLAAALSDPSSVVREKAALAAGPLGVPSAPALVQLLRT